MDIKTLRDTLLKQVLEPAMKDMNYSRAVMKSEGRKWPTDMIVLSEPGYPVEVHALPWRCMYCGRMCKSDELACRGCGSQLPATPDEIISSRVLRARELYHTSL